MSLFTTAPVPAPARSTERPVATVILPCYNEEDHVLLELERITAALDTSGLSYEVLAIDDASTDGTLAVLKLAAVTMPHLVVLAFRRNGGSGTARRIGTQRARGEIVVWTDADMTYPNERIPEFVHMLLEDPTYDQVVGARTREEGSHKWLRMPAKWFIRKVAERLTNQAIPDLNSGLRAFRRSVAMPYLRLLPAGFSCVTTITIAFLSNQHDVRYVPIEYAKRAGVSKFHFVRDAYRYILQVLRMVMYFDPLKVLMPPALILLLVGVVKAVTDMVRHPFYFPASTVLLVLTALIIGSMALLADLVVRSRADSQEDLGGAGVVVHDREIPFAESARPQMHASSSLEFPPVSADIASADIASADIVSADIASSAAAAPGEF